MNKDSSEMVGAGYIHSRRASAAGLALKKTARSVNFCFNPHPGDRYVRGLTFVADLVGPATNHGPGPPPKNIAQLDCQLTKQLA